MRAFQYNLLLSLTLIGLLPEYIRLGMAAFTNYAYWRSLKWYRLYFIIYICSIPVWFIARNLLGI